MSIAFVADGRLGAAIEYSFADEALCSDSAESIDDELERVLDDNFSLHYFVGGGVDGHTDPNPPGCGHVHTKDSVALLARFELAGG